MFDLQRHPTIKLFTMATDLNDIGLQQFIKTADKWGWDYDVFHLKKQVFKSENGVAQYKMELLVYILNHLQYNSYDFVGIVDGYDILINNSPDECIRRLYSANVHDGTLSIGVGASWNQLKPFSYLTKNKEIRDVLKPFNTTLSYSTNCKKVFNLGMVLGSQSIVVFYISKMLNLWHTINNCSSESCSEQKYFEYLLDSNVFNCYNNTLYIDENEMFIRNTNNCILNLNYFSSNPIFLHFVGKRDKCNTFEYQTHFYNLIMNINCNTNCPVCYNKNKYMTFTVIVLVICFILVCLCLKRFR